MKILVISDLHLTTRFDQKKCEFLEKLISRADRVIINGDFWSYYSCTFGEFVKSKWRRLFPLLQQKKAIYIYGNHDLKKWTDKRVNIFSTEQTSRYELMSGGKHFLVEHGHLLTLLKPIQNKYFLKLMRAVRFDDLIRYPLESLLPKIKIFKIFWGFSFKQKKIRRRVNKGKNYVVVGHTHYPLFENGKNYINTGFINFGIAHYLWIKDGVPRLVSRKY
jgi:predicted phosphodiesterase